MSNKFSSEYPMLDPKGLADLPNDFMLESFTGQYAIEAWQPDRNKSVILCLDAEANVSYVVELRAPTEEEQALMQKHYEELKEQQAGDEG